MQELGVDAAPVNLSAAGKVTSPGVPTDARSPRFPASLLPAVASGPDGRSAVAWTDARFRSGWTTARRVTGDGNATWPALAGDRVVFTSDRDARLQRDPTQGVDVVSAAGGRGGS